MAELKAQEPLLNNLQVQYKKEICALHIFCGLPDTTYEQLAFSEIKPDSSVSTANSMGVIFSVPVFDDRQRQLNLKKSRK